MAAATKVSKNGTGRHLNFELASRGDGEPITVKLGKEEFTCLPDIPGIYLAEFIAATEKEFGVRMEVALSFIRGSLIPADEERFEQTIKSKTVIIPVSVLVSLAVALVEEYSARPTSPPTD